MHGEEVRLARKRSNNYCKFSGPTCSSAESTAEKNFFINQIATDITEKLNGRP